MTIFLNKYLNLRDPILVTKFPSLDSLDAQTLSYSQMATTIRQTLRAVNHLHINDIIHEDIQPINIYMFSIDSMKTKLGGFHSAGTKSPTSVKSRRHRAPEIIRDSARYTNAVDLWSIGITILQYSLFGRFCVSFSAWAQKRPNVQQISRPGWQPLTKLANTMLICDHRLRSFATECISTLDQTEPTDQTDHQHSLNLSFLRKHKTTSLLKLFCADVHRDSPIAIKAVEACKILSLSHQRTRILLDRARDMANYCVSDDIYISSNDMATLLDGKDATSFTNAANLENLQIDVQDVHLARMSEGIDFYFEELLNKF